MMTDSLRRRWLGFGLYLAVAGALFFSPFRELGILSAKSSFFSYIPLVPLVSLFFLVVERRQIFARVDYAVAAGVPVAVAGLVVFGFLGLPGVAPDGGGHLAAAVFSAWLVVIGGFILFIGLNALREGIFPLVFLGFAVPLPGALMERIVVFLLMGSGVFTQLFFEILGVTYLREGSVFHLSRVTIEIAPECSGIRSSLALFITVTLAARLFLRTWWGRGLLLLAVVPLAMVKNAIRIVTLTLLAEHVDERFLTESWLHHSGGFVFFGITLVLFGGALLILRKLESHDMPVGAAGKRGGN